MCIIVYQIKYPLFCLLLYASDKIRGLPWQILASHIIQQSNNQ